MFSGKFTLVVRTFGRNANIQSLMSNDLSSNRHRLNPRLKCRFGKMRFSFKNMKIAYPHHFQLEAFFARPKHSLQTENLKKHTSLINMPKKAMLLVTSFKRE